MRVAVLTLTRDRLDYTKHCFARLHELAGCDFDHYVLDQGSADGTPEWLRDEYAPKWVELLPENVGIHKGRNILFDRAPGYDAYACMDNDCELVTDGTLETVAALVEKTGWILSPRVDGLLNPQHGDEWVDLEGWRVASAGALGNMLRTFPGDMIAQGFRFNEDSPKWGRDEAWPCEWWAGRGGNAGYLLDLAVNHYRTTAVQNEDYPDYFARKLAEIHG